MAELCKKNEVQTLSKTGDGNTEQEAKDAAKAAFDSFFKDALIESLKKDAEHDLKCAERECWPDDDGKSRECKFYWNPSAGQYVNDPEKHGSKIRVAYVVVVFYGCECKLKPEK